MKRSEIKTASKQVRVITQSRDFAITKELLDSKRFLDQEEFLERFGSMESPDLELNKYPIL